MDSDLTETELSDRKIWGWTCLPAACLDMQISTNTGNDPQSVESHSPSHPLSSPALRSPAPSATGQGPAGQGSVCFWVPCLGLQINWAGFCDQKLNQFLWVRNRGDILGFGWSPFRLLEDGMVSNIILRLVDIIFYPTDWTKDFDFTRGWVLI